MRFIEGNLLDAHEMHIAHGCNAQGVMGSGVAKAIREKWPEAYTHYRLAYESGGLFLGENIFCPVDNGEKIIHNLITQRYFGTDKRHVNYAAMNIALADALNFAAGYDIAIPLIGAGLGGGDRKIVLDIFKEVENMIDGSGEFVIYIPQSGVLLDTKV